MVNSINISIDTCVWLELLKVDFSNEDNLFEELCFWIENKHLNHIIPASIIDEWNRHKLGYLDSITKYFQKLHQDNIILFKNNKELTSTYQPDNIDAVVRSRIERINLILNTHSVKAPYSDTILIESANRNLKTLAPSHVKDSFRDTVNILSLIQYLKDNKCGETIFTTLNYKDFSASASNRYVIHEHLDIDFSTVSLNYVYFGESGDSFGVKLFGKLRKELPNFQGMLRERKKKVDEQELASKRQGPFKAIDSPDQDYLENIKYIDLILAKSKPTSFELELITQLTQRHESYKQYLLRNVGNNGLV